MNALYLNVLLNGSDALTEANLKDIEALAFTCPYVGGNAVYRARVLYGMKHFAVHYDDLEICNGQGVYKNGLTKLQEQLNQLNNHTPNVNNWLAKLQDDEVSIYPNPTSNKLNIACKNGSSFYLYDLLGNQVLYRKLDKTLEENKIEFSALPAGVYLYKVVKADNSTYNGKVIIE